MLELSIWIADQSQLAWLPLFDREIAWKLEMSAL
jgi:hypothetical protein